MHHDGIDDALTGRDTAHLSLVRRERELQRAFDHQLDAFVSELLDRVGGDPDKITEALEQMDRETTEAQDLVRAFLERLIQERLRRHILDNEHEPLDPGGTWWRKP